MAHCRLTVRPLNTGGCLRLGEERSSRLLIYRGLVDGQHGTPKRSELNLSGVQTGLHWSRESILPQIDSARPSGSMQPRTARQRDVGSKRRQRENGRTSVSSHKRATSSGPRLPPPPPRPRAWGVSAPPSKGIIDVDAVRLEDPQRAGGDVDLGLPGLRGRRGRTRNGVYETSGLPSLVAVKPQKASAAKNKHKATFV
ncbi:hypothetical protein SKAU_G00394540 [Synaphobranchus kaupii]|uniref:Uncharacterized protein n=1 Tax=Synaphobranchus kaupii TaxID=118154 RepID=A0A9Q1ECA2_SYNKA|nr:hypothetical protein SKAU_G00394540 [Synaphobranchus kaupii]